MSPPRTSGGGTPDPADALEVRQWRKLRRVALLAARMGAGGAQRKQWSQAIEVELHRLLPGLSPKAVGFYWPYKGEFDARPLVQGLIENGVAAALPAVVKPKTPLEFRRWAPGTELESGVYDIPFPKERDLVTPEILLVPLLGFDEAGYRLGYGGGYYDRTLASFAVRPYAIGIGFELSRLATIYPQPYDIPMNAIVTEAGLTVHRPRV